MKAIKVKNMEKRIFLDPRTQEQIALEAGVTSCTISRIKKSGVCREDTAEKIRNALGIKARDFYVQYEPKHKMTSPKDMVDIMQPNQLYADIKQAGFSCDSISRKIRRSRRFVATCLDEKRIGKNDLDAICRYIKTSSDKYLSNEHDDFPGELYDAVFDLVCKYGLSGVLEAYWCAVDDFEAYLKDCGIRYEETMTEKYEDLVKERA